MGDKPLTATEDIWLQIDGTVASHVGQRVYFNDPAHGKCLAFVTKAGFERDANGIKNNLIVFPPSGSPYTVVDVYLSSDKRAGTFDIAHPGDLTDSGTAPQTAPLVEETIVLEAPSQETLDQQAALIEQQQNSDMTTGLQAKTPEGEEFIAKHKGHKIKDGGN